MAFRRLLPGVTSPLSLRLSAAVTLFIVGSLLMLEWVTRGFDTGAQQGVLAIYFVFALIGGVGLAFSLDLLVTRPLGQVVGHVRRATRDGWTQPTPIPRGRGEIAELAVALEDLRLRVVEKQAALNELNEELEDRVALRTEELQSAQSQLVHAAKMAGVGQLGAGVAHEVNNPNGIILSRAGYLLSVADEEGLDPDVIEDLEIIESQSRRIAEVTGNLLKFGRRGAGVRATVDLTQLARLIAGLLSRPAQRAGVHLVIEAESDARAHGSHSELEQVVFNLVKNAIDASEQGGTVTVSTRPGAVQVTDEGSGVPDEVLPRIFEPFFTTKPVGSGTGLGLSVSYGIVTDHGGTIDATSPGPSGCGTVFTVTLPQEPTP
jgi:signal transduction histidine kinase